MTPNVHRYMTTLARSLLPHAPGGLVEGVVDLHLDRLWELLSEGEVAEIRVLVRDLADGRVGDLAFAARWLGGEEPSDETVVLPQEGLRVVATSSASQASMALPISRGTGSPVHPAPAAA